MPHKKYSVDLIVSYDDKPAVKFPVSISARCKGEAKKIALKNFVLKTGEVRRIKK